MKPIEDWAARKGLNPHLLAGLRAGERWAAGKQCTEAEFDAALARLHAIVVR